MRLRDKFPRPLLRAVVCLIAVAATASCGQQGNQVGQGSVTSGSPSAAPDTAPHSRFTPLKPDASQAATFDYTVYEFAKDGSWISIVPMPPRSGDIVVRVDVAGSYEVKLTNSKCASSVNVSPSIGNSFVLTATEPKHGIAVSKRIELKISMSDSALNNYFCNVAIAEID